MQSPQAAGSKPVVSSKLEAQASGSFGLEDLCSGPPPIHLLNNDRMVTMVTAAGSGYVQHEETALTRWCPDRTLDRDGYHVYVRDVERDKLWSLGYEPTCSHPDSYRCEFEIGAARFLREDHGIESTLEICQAADVDVELRRCTFRNQRSTTRTIEVTSYLEFVLQSQAADNGHPAFSKLFVETSVEPTLSAVFARRRPAKSADPERVACHFMVGEAGQGQDRFETSRARFLGRGQSLSRPQGLVGASGLSGVSGAVLDPVGSLQRLFLLEPNESACVTYFLAPTADRREVERLVERFANPAELSKAFADAREAAANALQKEGLSHEEALRIEQGIARQLYAAPVGRPEAELLSGPRFVRRPHIARLLGKAVSSEAVPSVGQRVDRKDPAHSETGALGLTDETAAGPVVPLDRRDPAELLRCFNGLGGFSQDGREYVMRLVPGPDGRLKLPPMPWSNVVANERAGFIATETGAGYTWARNSRENRLTPWQNDPISDPHSEALYVRDQTTSEYWSAAPGPTPNLAEYEVRHGFGYTVYRHQREGLHQELTVFVPRDEAVKVAWLRLTNSGDEERRLSVFAYCQWALSGGDPAAARHIETRVSESSTTVVATNGHRDTFADGRAFAALRCDRDANGAHATCDRGEFLGRHGSLAAPLAVARDLPLSGRCGKEHDPCAALKTTVVVPAGESRDCFFLIGESVDEAECAATADRLGSVGAVQEALSEVRGFWSDLLGAVQIETPSDSLDMMVNGWLSYQNLSCRLWGRSAYYQSGGAFGFRDQLQDSAAFVLQRPEIARRQILLNAGHQFVEGDVMHWWHPPHDLGIRTRFSDDLLWLPLFAAEYVQATGDESLWDEEVPFLESPPVEPGEAERLVRPTQSAESATVYEHCCRALERGAHQRPERLAADGVRRLERRHEPRRDRWPRGECLAGVLYSVHLVPDPAGL